MIHYWPLISLTYIFEFVLLSFVGDSVAVLTFCNDYIRCLNAN